MKKPLAFVTGATGLLGNNLVRALLNKGYSVRALARSAKKANRLLGMLNVDIVEGDLQDISRFTTSLSGVRTVFHTAAYFRDSYKGGKHWKQLYEVNVKGTRNLLQAAFDAGVRRFVHTSSIAVLDCRPGEIADETMLRREEDADDYYRSKILSDRELLHFLDQHSDMWGAMVLPGWMHGPWDAGPTAAGQSILDFMHGKLPGIPPGSVSLVDARDVANAMILVEECGRRSERYLAAGRHITMLDLFSLLERISGRKAPARKIPLSLLYVLGAAGELQARLTGKPALLSWATVRGLAKEADKSHFSSEKSNRELGLELRPMEDTLRDELQWYCDNGYINMSGINEKSFGAHA